jgi:TonB family protein
MKHDKRDRFVKQPTFPGGMAEMKKFIGKELRYPELALQNGIEGVVTLRFDINNKGEVDNVQLITGIGHGCDEEAIRLVLMLKFAVNSPKGLRVTYHKNLNIHFNLHKTEVVTPVPEPEIPEAAVPPQTQPSMQISYSVKPKTDTIKPETPKTPPSGYKIVYTLK